MFDGSQRRCAGAAIVSGNHEMISLGLGDSRGNRAHTDFRYQFDADACLAVCVLQVVNQLRDVLNRIDIVMRRRADQTHARGRVSDSGDLFVHLAAWQLASFARFGALSDLDLKLICISQIPCRDSEPPGSDLFDGRALRIAIGHRREAFRIFSAFSGIGFAAQAIHRHSQRLVAFLRDRSKTHRTGGKALDDLTGRFDFFQRDRFILFSA